MKRTGRIMDRRRFLKNVIGGGIVAGSTVAFGNYSELLAATLAAAPAYDLVAVRGGEPGVMFDRAMASLGGMQAFVPKGSRVVVKPNIGWDVTPERGGQHESGARSAHHRTLPAGRCPRGVRFRPHLRPVGAVLQIERHREGGQGCRRKDRVREQRGLLPADNRTGRKGVSPKSRCTSCCLRRTCSSMSRSSSITVRRCSLSA